MDGGQTLIDSGEMIKDSGKPQMCRPSGKHTYFVTYFYVSLNLKWMKLKVKHFNTIQNHLAKQ